MGTVLMRKGLEVVTMFKRLGVLKGDSSMVFGAATEIQGRH